MHFYDYYSPTEELENPCYLAAQSLIEHGLEVIPLLTGTKEPSGNIDKRNLAIIRQNPINKHNVSFFFNRDVEIALMLRRNMEVIDVDEKNKEGLAKEFLFAFKNGWPELYEKVVISKTPNKGLHILYRSEIVGGQEVLAKVNANPHPLAIIERINESNKNYIKCAPSKGYEFIQGNPMEMPTLTADERNWLSALAASFHKLQDPEVKPKEAARDDSPWKVYNEQKDWTWILSELKERGWEEVMDLKNRVVIKRPGSKQHSGNIWKDTNTLYLFTASSEFEPSKQYSPFGVYCHYYHDGNVALACQHLASEGIGKNKFDEGQFWIRKGKKIQVKYTDLVQWLHSIGYRIHQNEIVKITDNVVSIVDPSKLRSLFLDEVEPYIADEFYEKVSTIFSDTGGLMSKVGQLEDKFIKDTKNETWLFFKNYAVKITPTAILPMQYREVSGYVWESSIIDRNFYNGDYAGCDADRFVRILGGNKYKDLQKLLGYTLSRYKDPINPRAVVLTEDIDAEDEGESQGGSGKGLLFSFVKQFRKVADFDGKNFKTSDTFLYQSIELDTNIIFIDDVERKFNFTSLFSILTGSLLVNKKNKPQIVIPYPNSPKIFITSNYSVGAMDISSERRKYEFAVVKHFGKEYEPIDEFGRQFFNEWDNDEWAKFDNFMAECCKSYLASTDKKHIGNVTANSAERSLLANTNKDFVDYMDGQLAVNFFEFAPNILKNWSGQINNEWTTNGVNYDLFVERTLSSSPSVDYYIAISKEDLLNKISTKLRLKTLTTTKLTQWVKKWAESRNVEVDTKYRRGENNEMCYRIVDFKSVHGDKKVNIENKSEPFNLF